MNKKILTVSTMATTLVFGGISATTANAATWHKGTPKFLRGIWAEFYKKMPSIHQKGVYRLKVTKKNVYCILDKNSNPITNVSWKKNGKKYVVKGKTLGRSGSIKVIKHGSKIEVSDPIQSFMMAKYK
ncbi:hypothetical protein [Lentilactobacillus sp. Marseille-Q4993]|uniref:hypothetical protein n=1 Tax=Lentilactobacillus sp. Marseille-Q4993 TaxID=3039492 RepID=UPI0024BC249E|nr:hypothetical protein [Lentilactobacillus sp. Marseille-Q4993]